MKETHLFYNAVFFIARIEKLNEILKNIYEILIGASIAVSLFLQTAQLLNLLPI